MSKCMKNIKDNVLECTVCKIFLFVCFDSQNTQEDHIKRPPSLYMRCLAVSRTAYALE